MSEATFLAVGPLLLKERSLGLPAMKHALRLPLLARTGSSEGDGRSRPRGSYSPSGLILILSPDLRCDLGGQQHILFGVQFRYGQLGMSKRGPGPFDAEFSAGQRRERM